MMMMMMVVERFTRAQLRWFPRRDPVLGCEVVNGMHICWMASQPISSSLREKRLPPASEIYGAAAAHAAPYIHTSHMFSGHMCVRLMT